MIEITKFTRVPIFNGYDEFARLLGIERLPGETNRELRRRIYLAGRYFGSSTKQGLVDAISSELDLERYNATDKTFYYLSYMPITLYNGTSYPFKVLIDEVEWYDYDLFPNEANYFRLWKLRDGQTTRILELNDTFQTGQHLRVVYYRLEDNAPARWIDESYGPDNRFVTYKSELPSSGQVEIYELNDEDFKNTYLLDPDGNPTETFTTIVKQIHEAYPILWGKFTWDKTYYDVGDKQITGLEYLPSRFDALTTYISGQFGSGIGYGYDCAVYDDITHSDDSQHVLIKPGYFWIDEQEFYLFGSKTRRYATTLDPDLESYIYNSPIILSITSGPLYLDNHFVETWSEARKNRIYLQTYDLSGCISGDYDGQWDVPWFTMDASGHFTISGSPSIYRLEYDTSESYTYETDFNPAHYANFTNRFLVIQDDDPVPTSLELTYVDGYMKKITDVTSITVRADLFGSNGTVIPSGYSVSFSLVYGVSTSLGSATETIGVDGSCYHTFTDVFSGLTIGSLNPRDLQVTGAVLKSGSPIGITSYLHIPVGA